MIQTLFLRAVSSLLFARRKKRRSFFGWLWTRIILLALVAFFWYILVGPEEEGGMGRGQAVGARPGGSRAPGFRQYGSTTTTARVIDQRQPASQAPRPTAPPLAERPAPPPSPAPQPEAPAPSPVEEALSSSRSVSLEQPAGAGVPTAPPPFEAAEEEALAAPTPDTLAPSGEAAKAEADDLALIEGIGSRISALLKENGINTFEELANAGSERIEAVLSGANLRMVDASTWAEQARLVASGDWEGFERLKGELKGGRRA